MAKAGPPYKITSVLNFLNELPQLGTGTYFFSTGTYLFLKKTLTTTQGNLLKKLHIQHIQPPPTNSKMFIPHGVNSDRGFRQASLQLIKGNIQAKLHQLIYAELQRQRLQTFDPRHIFVVSAASNQNQTMQPALLGALQSTDELPECFQLEGVVLLRPKL